MADPNNSQQIKIPSYLKFSKVIVWLLYLWVLIGVISLTLRVFLLALAANPSAGFVEFVYNVSNDYLKPFRGIFPPRTVGQDGYLDTAAIFAIVVYLFVAWGFKALIDYVQHKIDIARIQRDAQMAKLEKEQLAENRSRSTTR